MAATAAAKLANITRNPSLPGLIRRNLLRIPVVSSAAESQLPALFNRNPANLIPALGVSYGMMGLPRVDQSPTIMECAGKRKPAVKDDSDSDIAIDDDDVCDDDFPPNDYDSDDYPDSD